MAGLAGGHPAGQQFVLVPMSLDAGGGLGLPWMTAPQAVAGEVDSMSGSPQLSGLSLKAPDSEYAWGELLNSWGIQEGGSCKTDASFDGGGEWPEPAQPESAQPEPSQQEPAPAPVQLRRRPMTASLRRALLMPLQGEKQAATAAEEQLANPSLSAESVETCGRLGQADLAGGVGPASACHGSLQEPLAVKGKKPHSKARKPRSQVAVAKKRLPLVQEQNGSPMSAAAPGTQLSTHRPSIEVVLTDKSCRSLPVYHQRPRVRETWNSAFSALCLEPLASHRVAPPAAGGQAVACAGVKALCEEHSDSVAGDASKPCSAPVVEVQELLRFRSLAKDATPPSELETLLSAVVETVADAEPPRSPSSTVATPPSPVASPVASPAYRMRPATAEPPPRMQQLRRQVMSHLNKVCPENVPVIVERIAQTELLSADDLEVVVSLVFDRALAEPHYCETYADMVFALRARLPEFPDPDGGKPVSVKSALLNVCQGEFESLPEQLAKIESEAAECSDREEADFRRKKRKGRIVANMRLIGHLFLRRLLSVRIVEQILLDLAGCRIVADGAAESSLPEDGAIECVCELLSSVGFTLESNPVCKHIVSQVCGRLLDLRQRKTATGRDAYCKRIQYLMQDLLDTRAAGWKKTVFKSSAKTKDEIRDEQRSEHLAQERGLGVPSGELVVAGKRPSYLE